MNLPAAFTSYTRSLLGDDEYAKLALALQVAPPVSIRLNKLKLHPEAYAYPAVPWAATGRYLDRRLTFTFDPLFHAGSYYVQEASSMFVEQAIYQYVQEPVVALDLCAAPGGKSTHLRSLLPEGSLLVANEVIRSRAQVLAENLTKWGHPDVAVTTNDPADFQSLPALFDLILADVPCSGEGMFRKDATAREEWSVQNVDICWQRQRRIIADVWPSLKPGGLLIYSTCTFNTKEDEENVLWIAGELGAEVMPIATHEAWDIGGSLLSGADASMPVYHFFPHRTQGEGFFLALLRKSDDADTGSPTPYTTARRKPAEKKGAKAPTPSKENLRTAESWLSPQASAHYTLTAEGTSLRALPTCHLNELSLLKQQLHLLQAGVEIGEAKGKDLIPAHALAMSTPLLRKEAFANIEIDYSQAIAYLRKEAIVLPPETPRGYVLLTYQHLPLGFAKNIGNRANNLYPAEWRIRSGYLPEEVSTLLNQGTV